MPIIPNFMERLILFRLNLGPAPALDLYAALAFRAAAVAVRLGVFEALRGGPLTAAQLARQIEADERGTTRLLEALDAVGYVKKKRDGCYAATAMTAKWLPRLAGGFRMSERNLLQPLEYLEKSIRTGEPSFVSYERYAEMDRSWWRDQQDAMIAVARMVGDDIVARVKLPETARRLLDVGGGHGLHAIKFCRRYLQLSATVFDLPQALEVAQEVIAAEAMGERVSVQAGDFWKDDLGAGYDAALVFSILQMNPPDKNMELLRKVAGALNPGGLVVIQDQVAGRAPSPTAKAVLSLQGLSQLVSSRGRTYAFDEFAGWLTAAGFRKPRRISLWKTPGVGLVVGTKAA